jgi:ankyrin repeat protein
MREDWLQAEKLHFAAMDGDASRCAQLIAEDYDPSAFDELGKTPLHYAAENEHLDVVALLISHGADVNARHEPSIGNTPLAEAAGSCSLRMARMLLDAGADPTIRSWMQLNAIDRAQDRKRGDGPRVYELLRRYAANQA